MNMDQPTEGAEIEWFFNCYFYQSWMHFYSHWQDVVHEAARDLNQEDKSRIVSAIQQFVASKSDGEIQEFLEKKCCFLFTEGDPSPSAFLTSVSSMLLR